jgi:hypothetical protein
MRTQSQDTHPEAERVLIDLIRKAPIAKRFGLVRSMTTFATRLNQQNIQQLHPGLAKEEVAITFVKDHYNRALAYNMRPVLKRRETAFTADLLDALLSMTTIFEVLNVRYYVKGSIALSLYGMQRATFDIDFVAHLEPEHFDNAVSLLKAACYVDEGAVKNVIEKKAGFETVHLDSMLKISVSPAKNTALDKMIDSRLLKHIVAANNPTINVASPEDIIITQLQEYKAGGEVADDQWNDILGVFKIQGESLDSIYLGYWASELGFAHLLTSAYFDAGLKNRLASH